eukprot:TRINITY_DN6570_c0_g1_i1.p1 TRINITY_DN6570_c0_g1~~TRINITY_DN6570_c0_g1_i1.p1  ORF type:complete len:1696 (+),score=308.21 TRINITY_DN6570_c0_g1_i1:35-5122(+)
MVDVLGSPLLTEPCAAREAQGDGLHRRISIHDPSAMPQPPAEPLALALPEVLQVKREAETYSPHSMAQMYPPHSMVIHQPPKAVYSPKGAEFPSRPEAASCPICGNVYMADAVYCRRCGCKRDTAQESSFDLQHSELQARSLSFRHGGPSSNPYLGRLRVAWSAWTGLVRAGQRRLRLRKLQEEELRLASSAGAVLGRRRCRALLARALRCWRGVSEEQQSLRSEGRKQLAAVFMAWVARALCKAGKRPSRMELVGAQLARRLTAKLAMLDLGRAFGMWRLLVQETFAEFRAEHLQRLAASRQELLTRTLSAASLLDSWHIARSGFNAWRLHTAEAKMGKARSALLRCRRLLAQRFEDDCGVDTSQSSTEALRRAWLQWRSEVHKSRDLRSLQHCKTQAKHVSMRAAEQSHTSAARLASNRRDYLLHLVLWAWRATAVALQRHAESSLLRCRIERHRAQLVALSLPRRHLSLLEASAFRCWWQAVTGRRRNSRSSSLFRKQQAEAALSAIVAAWQACASRERVLAVAKASHKAGLLTGRVLWAWQRQVIFRYAAGCRNFWTTHFANSIDTRLQDLILQRLLHSWWRLTLAKRWVERLRLEQKESSDKAEQLRLKTEELQQEQEEKRIKAEQLQLKTDEGLRLAQKMRDRVGGALMASCDRRLAELTKAAIMLWSAQAAASRKELSFSTHWAERLQQEREESRSKAEQLRLKTEEQLRLKTEDGLRLAQKMRDRVGGALMASCNRTLAELVKAAIMLWRAQAAASRKEQRTQQLEQQVACMRTRCWEGACVAGEVLGRSGVEVLLRSVLCSWTQLARHLRSKREVFALRDQIDQCGQHARNAAVRVASRLLPCAACEFFRAWRGLCVELLRRGAAAVQERQMQSLQRLGYWGAGMLLSLSWTRAAHGVLRAWHQFVGRRGMACIRSSFLQRDWEAVVTSRTLHSWRSEVVQERLRMRGRAHAQEGAAQARRRALDWARARLDDALRCRWALCEWKMVSSRRRRECSRREHLTTLLSAPWMAWLASWTLLMWRHASLQSRHAADTNRLRKAVREHANLAVACLASGRSSGLLQATCHAWRLCAWDARRLSDRLGLEKESAERRRASAGTLASWLQDLQLQSRCLRALASWRALAQSSLAGQLVQEVQSKLLQAVLTSWCKLTLWARHASVQAAAAQGQALAKERSHLAAACIGSCRLQVLLQACFPAWREKTRASRFAAERLLTRASGRRHLQSVVMSYQEQHLWHCLQHVLHLWRCTSRAASAAEEWCRAQARGVQELEAARCCNRERSHMVVVCLQGGRSFALLQRTLAAWHASAKQAIGFRLQAAAIQQLWDRHRLVEQRLLIGMYPTSPSSQSSVLYRLALDSWRRWSGVAIRLRLVREVRISGLLAQKLSHVVSSWRMATLKHRIQKENTVNVLLAFFGFWYMAVVTERILRAGELQTRSVREICSSSRRRSLLACSEVASLYARMALHWLLWHWFRESRHARLARLSELREGGLQHLESAMEQLKELQQSSLLQHALSTWRQVVIVRRLDAIQGRHALLKEAWCERLSSTSRRHGACMQVLFLNRVLQAWRAHGKLQQQPRTLAHHLRRKQDLQRVLLCVLAWWHIVSNTAASRVIVHLQSDLETVAAKLCDSEAEGIELLVRSVLTCWRSICHARKQARHAKQLLAQVDRLSVESQRRTPAAVVELPNTR